jgi:N-acylneuraminate cytidylyltransferase
MSEIKYLAVIPARGGSKGIPRKNIKMIAGKPLIAWSIEAVKKSHLVDRVVVSTEDDEIARVARRYGAEVINRPVKLATDKATTLSVLQHVLTQIPAAAVVLLQPTSPIRSEGLIDQCVRKFQKTKVDNLGTGFICKFMEYGSYVQRRQDLKGFFYDDGNVYVIKSDLIKSGKLHGKKRGTVLISREENVEIDEEFDFWLAEQILLKRKRARKS